VRFTTIFFDLDDTLYPASSGLWPTLKDRMTQYMIGPMHIPAADVPGLRETYFREYGTTLRGLQIHHALDTDEYLAFVHEVRLADYIQPDPVQQAVLASLPTRNIVFTNADANHARRVLGQLGIQEYFSDVLDVNRMEPYCKPSPQAFRMALEVSGELDPARCVMIDDLPRTTRAAHDFGMFSVLFGAETPDGSADAACTQWNALANILAETPG